MTKNILVVDDEDDVRDAIKTVLEGANYSVATAGGAEDALALLRENEYDLALLDFFMPGMDGIELCEAIRADSALEGLKLAFLTVATFSKEEKQRLDELGVLDHILKPFDNADLVTRVGKLAE